MEEKQSPQPTMRNGNGQAPPSSLPSGASNLVANGYQQPEMSPTSKEFRESSSFATRRKSSQMLSPLRLKQTPVGVDVIDGQEDRIEVEEEGVSLFINVFLEEELDRNGIPETVVIEEAVTSATIESKQKEPVVNVSAFQFNPQVQAAKNMSNNGSITPSLLKYKNPKWAKNGRDLRQLADQFAKSRARDGVKEKARETVEDNEITAAMFWDLLSELFFQGNITRERIVVLFFFCSDVAIFALQKNSIEYFHRFMVWALQYIRNHVCRWVANNGGWDQVLYHLSADKLVFLGKVAIAAAVAYGVYKLGKVTYASITKR
uniref:BCL2L8 n=1 Tax=Paracentrotus lividus TaxID=7656 RepID=A0AAU7NIB8_PARLI